MHKTLLILAALLAISTGCTRIAPGYEGIKVNLMGDNRGVDDVTIVTGLAFYNPFSTEVHEFPVHIQGYIYPQIAFTTKDQISVTVDVETRLAFRPTRTPQIYVRHRQSPQDIVQTYMRSQHRDAFVRCGGEVDVMDFLGGGGVVKVQDCAKAYLTSRLGEDYEFDTVVVSSRPAEGVPERIRTMIERTAEARQEAEQSEQQVRVREAEAQQAVAVARGTAEARLIDAEATAEANRKINASLTTNLVQYEAIKKWNGIQPQVMAGGGVVPVINLGGSK